MKEEIKTRRVKEALNSHKIGKVYKETIDCLPLQTYKVQTVADNHQDQQGDIEPKCKAYSNHIVLFIKLFSIVLFKFFNIIVHLKQTPNISLLAPFVFVVDISYTFLRLQNIQIENDSQTIIVIEGKSAYSYSLN